VKKWFKHIIGRLNLVEKVLILAFFYLALFSLGGMAYQYYLTLSEPVLVRGGDYVEGMIGRVHSLNPLYAYSTVLDQELSKLIFAGLVRYDPVAGEYLPDLAEKWEWQEADKAYLFTLKSGLKWHDGMPLTMADVIYTFAAIQAPAYTGLLKEAFNEVVIEQLNEQQLRFKLPLTNYFFLSALTTGIVPKHKLANTDLNDLERAGFSKSPVGSGRFAFVSLKEKKNYDEITLRPLAAEAAISQLVMRGFDSLPELWRDRSNLTAIRGVVADQLAELDPSQEGFLVNDLRLPRYGILFFDTLSTGPTANAKVRLGIKYAINKQELVAVLTEAELMNFPLPSLDSDTVAYDLKRSAALLFEAGWGVYAQKYNDEIRRNAKGEKLTLKLATQDGDYYRKIVAVLAKQLAQAGIELEAQFLSQSSLYQEVIRQRDYNLLLFSQDLGENEDFYPFLHSSQIIDSGANIAQFKDVQTDLVLNKIRAGQTSAERLAAVSELKNIINQAVPFIFLYRPYFLYLTRDDVGKLEFLDYLSSPKDRFYYFENWYRKSIRRWR